MSEVKQIPSEAGLRSELESLQQEATQLNERRIRIQTELERAKEERDRLKAELEAEFGTSDVELLQGQLEQRARSNAQAVAQYRQGIESMRVELARVNEELTKAV